MASAASAREAARLGRIEQLKVLGAYERGETVTFVVHNNAKGFKLNKKDVQVKPKTATALRLTDMDLLMDGAVNGDADRVQALLDRGVDPNLRDADGLTALHRSVDFPG